MYLRGAYNFEVSADGDILYSKNNVELLRRLWLDREIIQEEELGPGDPGDFDNGAWHIACHLIAAGGIRRTKDGKLLWLEISYDQSTEVYYPSLTYRNNEDIVTLALTSIQAQKFIKNSEIIGFVEGTSEGRISAKGVIDNEILFNKNLRQEYDQEPGSSKEGGKVWEHWCTTRDIRKSSRIGSSVIESYLALVAACGDEYVATVARGRVEYSHPEQLRAMIKSGFISLESAQLNIIPIPIPYSKNLLLQEATPQTSLQAVERLDWSNPPKYYMFPRRIDKWNKDQIII